MNNITTWPTCPDQLTPEEVATFKDQGFLAFNNVFSPEEVEESRQRISRLIRDVSNDPTAKHHANRNHQELQPAQGRFGVQFEPGVKLDDLSDEEKELSVRKLMWYCEVDPYFGDLSTNHPRIQTILRQLLGSIPTLFQDMALIKPPKIGTIKPWHQDNAYFSMLPLDAVIGVWIALDDATIENGCMHVIPGGHAAGAKRHFHGRDCEIVSSQIDEAKALPIEIQAGGALFFYGMLPHQTPPNHSSDRRRALQWHYHAAHARKVSAEEFDAVYVDTDGVAASCLAAENRTGDAI